MHSIGIYFGKILKLLKLLRLNRSAKNDIINNVYLYVIKDSEDEAHESIR